MQVHAAALIVLRRYRWLGRLANLHALPACSGPAASVSVSRTCDLRHLWAHSAGTSLLAISHSIASFGASRLFGARTSAGCLGIAQDGNPPVFH